MKILIEYDENYYEAAPEYPEHFKKQGHEVVVFPSNSKTIGDVPAEKIKEMVAGCDIISRQNIKITEELLDLAPNLRLITTFGAGFDGANVELCGKRGIPVINGRGGGAPSVAELSIGMMMSLSRKLPKYDHEMRKDVWNGVMGSELTGKTVGIIGVGAIGGYLAKMVVHGFDAKVLAYDVVPNPELTEKYGVEYVSLETLCRESDYISLHTPLFPSTRGMINKSLFDIMKPTAFFINVSRGPVVVEEDLYEALKNGKIAGAGLDVFDPEPPVNNRFAEMENVVMTPHVGANTAETATRIAAMHIQSIEDAIAGREIRGNIVNKQYLNK